MFTAAYNWASGSRTAAATSRPDGGANCWNDANLGVKLALPVTSKFTITPAMYWRSA
jgi:hypothetical protein